MAKLSLRELRALLARHARGELSASEEASLVVEARRLRRRLDRLRAIDPESYGDITLGDELDALIQPSVLTASA